MIDERRKKMVENDLRLRDISDDNVLKAMLAVPRHKFIAEKYRSEAYGDHPLPLENGQTISQPYIVALMTQLLELNESSRVLEIGSGSGYQTAVLAEIAKEVYSIEIIPNLAEQASIIIKELGYSNVSAKAGDGSLGWPDEAPFDAIMVTAAAPIIPQILIDQLSVGGKMVIPIGDDYQELKLISRDSDDYSTKDIIPVRFVPMTGEIRKKR